jgi:hypothetical protein
LKGTGWAQGVCVGDYNNDGFEDLFLTYYGQNILYRNNGDGTFTDVTEKAGLLYPTDALQHRLHVCGLQPRWACSICLFQTIWNRSGQCSQTIDGRAQLQLRGRAGDVRARRSAQGAQLSLPQQRRWHIHRCFEGVRGCRVSRIVWADRCGIDADEDGWPDIFVACDSTPSMLLMNNHDGTFREEALFRGLALSGEGRKMGGMGVCAGDYNLDGHTDLVKTHYYNQATGLYRGDGKGNFEDVTIEAGLNKETRFVCLARELVDFDNDGYPDMFLSTGSCVP